ncbi:MAG: nuclear transport factor 2 family protein [Spirochaetes bacterium]|nr:nuclear transport factor 2 family protein [Spirochaetota bacterium]
MKKIFKIAVPAIMVINFFILSTGCFKNSGVTNNNYAGGHTDLDAIEKPIFDYVEGWYDKDPERMKKGLHPDLAKRSIDPAKSNGINKMDLPSLLSIVHQYGGQNAETRIIDIKILDVYQNIATAKVTTNDYIDYVQLGYMSNKWMIINVLWEFKTVKTRKLTSIEIKSLEKPILDYVEGWYDKDSKRMMQGLHKDLAKRSMNPEKPNGIEQYTLKSLLEILPIYGGQNGNDRIIDIKILDVSGNIASVKVTSNFFVDYIHLCYLVDQWWDLNVLWAFKK